MSESLLRALMQLFAIVANVSKEDISQNSRNIVTSYLKSFLPQHLVKKYLEVFDEYLLFHNSAIKNYSSRHSLQGIKLLKICQEINDQLLQSQKYVVLIELLEFIRNSENITEVELDFAETVARVFNISDDEYEHCKAFVLDPDFTLHDCILIIDKNLSHPNANVKHIHRENLSGQLIVLYVKSAKMYFFRYSGNDTFYLNNQSIAINRTYMLDTGVSLRSPRINTIYYNEITEKFLETSSFLNLTFIAKSVEYRFNGGDTGIKDFNFYEKSGSMIGILGDSGAGKSTLINLLNGKLKPGKGVVLVNNIDIHKNPDKINKIIGYVPQDDLLIEELTVFQNLFFNAKLCFGNLHEDEIQRRVVKILKDLDLYDIRYLKVGSPLKKYISGGERKRLNMALELIREPDILFVDEPTSGLSSMDSMNVLDLLKEQALMGRLVIITIHQPSSDMFKMFDRTLVLDKGGYTVYYGNPVEAISYFKITSQQANFSAIQCETCGNLNPESVLHIVDARVVDEYGKLTYHRRISPAEWHDFFKANIRQEVLAPNTDDIPERNTRIAGRLQQLKIFFKRDLLSKLSNAQYLLINFIEAPLLAIIIGYFGKYYSQQGDGDSSYIFAFNENIPICLFISVIVALFMGLTVSVEEIIRDRKFHEREAFLKLSRASYLLAKVFLLFIISAVQTLMFVILANSLLEIKGMYFSYWLALFSASCFSNITGLNISSCINSVITVYILIPVLLIPQILFCGIVVDYDKLHKSMSSQRFVPLIGDIMVSRWAYEALSVNQFKNNEFEKYFFETEKQMSRYSYLFNYLIPELQERISACDTNLLQKKNVEETALISKRVENEINMLKSRYIIEKLNQPIDNTQVEINNFFKDYLERLSAYCVTRYSELRVQKEKIVQELNSKQNMGRLKLDYYNEKLADLALNYRKEKKIVQDDEYLVQKADPVFKEPESRFIRAHFYASEKKIFSESFDTYWFNIIIIWTAIVLLYALLYFDIFNRLLSFSRKKYLKLS